MLAQSRERELGISFLRVELEIEAKEAFEVILPRLRNDATNSRTKHLSAIFPTRENELAE